MPPRKEGRKVERKERRTEGYQGRKGTKENKGRTEEGQNQI
jgi:hypothetical protein